MLLGCASATQAQNPQGHFSIKPLAGVNISMFSPGNIDRDFHIKAGLSVGMELEYGVSDRLGLSLGAIYTQQRAGIDYEITQSIMDADGNLQSLFYTNQKVKANCSYVALPLLANVYIPGVKGLAVKAGVQASILTSDLMHREQLFLKQNFGLPDTNMLSTFHPTELSTLIENQTDFCHSVDFGIPLGISYEYKGLMLDARYYFGLMDMDVNDDLGNSHNGCLSVTLGYRFHL